MRLRALRARALRELRRVLVTWRRRRTSDAQILHDLEIAYQPGDPWNMTGDKEQFRFRETNRILRNQVLAPRQKVGSILEIGSGEGHQSEHLAVLCERLTGIDVVSSAVERARVRLPAADFVAGELEAQPWIHERARFDLVTAFEVLYYFRDIPKTLATMSRLGRACMITYYRSAAHLIDRPLRAMPAVGRARFAFDNVEWHAAWWGSLH